MGKRYDICMALALFRMNQYKEVFRKYRTADAKKSDGHFNLPKWHVVVHYIEMIKLYGCAPE